MPTPGPIQGPHNSVGAQEVNGSPSSAPGQLTAAHQVRCIWQPALRRAVLPAVPASCDEPKEFSCSADPRMETQKSNCLFSLPSSFPSLSLSSPLSPPLPSPPILFSLSVFSVYWGKRYSQEEKVTLCLPLHSPRCIWNIPAQTIRGSDSGRNEILQFWEPG